MRNKILLIEDTHALAESIIDVLSMEGYETRLTPNGLEGLLQLEEYQPSLIISDLVMPKMDGITFLTLARQQIGDSIPIIILSAKADDKTVSACLELGANAFLKKPCDIDLLLSSVNSLLSKTGLG